MLLGRTDSTIAGFWAAFIAEVWHQRNGLHHQCLCLWEGPAFPHCPHCATEVVPFGFVPSIPIQEQKLEICLPPVQDDTILGPILQTVSTLPEGLDLSTSCLLYSHDMGLNMLAKPKLPMVHHYFLMKMPNPVCDMM